MWGGLKIQKVQGFATLLFTMVILMSITAFAFLSAQSVVTHQRVVVSAQKEQSAFNIAQAGLDYAIPYLNANYATIENGSSQRMNMPGGGYATVSFAFVGDKDTIRVTSVGHSADDVASVTMGQTVKYQTNSLTKTLSQPVTVRNSFSLLGAALVNGNATNFTSVKLSDTSDVTIAQSATTQINGVTISKSSAKGADLIADPSIFLPSSTAQEIAILGQSISDYAKVSTDVTVDNAGTTVTTHVGTNPTKNVPVRYFFKSNFDPYASQKSMTIASNIDVDIGKYTASSITLGTANNPIVLEINLLPNPDPKVKPIAKIIRANIYGDVIVRGGNLELDTASRVIGNVIVESGYAKVVTGGSYAGSAGAGNIQGALIASGNIDLVEGTISGLVYSGGNIKLHSNQARTTVMGGLYANNNLSAIDNSVITYNSALATITAKNASASGSYGKVAGSWSDI